MAWLQKRPQVSNNYSYFVNSNINSSFVLVGLGNPEKNYDLTRHNIGFEVIDYYQKKASIEFSDWQETTKFKGLISQGQLNASKIYLLKPLTYMNDSGLSIQAFINFYKIPPTNVIVIHDDLDLDFGTIRIRLGGSSAGHNGIKSIINLIGDEFYRFRIGIANKDNPKIEAKDFVLAKFSINEQKQLNNLKIESTAILSEYLFNNKVTEQTRSFII